MFIDGGFSCECGLCFGLVGVTVNYDTKVVKAVDALNSSVVDGHVVLV